MMEFMNIVWLLSASLLCCHPPQESYIYSLNVLHSAFEKVSVILINNL